MTQVRQWTAWEDEQLREWAVSGRTLSWLGMHLGRDTSVVRRRLQVLGLREKVDRLREHPGVCRIPSKGKWGVRFQREGRTQWLGTYATFEDACRVADEWAALHPPRKREPSAGYKPRRPDDAQWWMDDVHEVASRRPVRVTPERAFCAAMLETALEDLRSLSASVRQEAREWFAGRRGVDGAGFLEVAEALGLDIDAVRERLGVSVRSDAAA